MPVRHARYRRPQHTPEPVWDMANPELLEILKKGVEEWNAWRSAQVYGLPSRDLAGADLSGRDLQSAELHGMDLSGAELSHVRLDRAILGSANLRGADLNGASLRQARLDRADLSGADLSEADLTVANLLGANLRGANLSVARLTGTNLYQADLTEADLSYARLDGTMFGSTDLTGAVLDNVFFNGPSPLDPGTVRISAGLPESFLRGCGWPDWMIEGGDADIAIEFTESVWQDLLLVEMGIREALGHGAFSVNKSDDLLTPKLSDS